MAGWTDGDNMTAKRRNREWVMTRLFHPVYDISNGGTVTANAKVHDGDGPDIVTSETTHYTAAQTVAIIHKMTITNLHTAAHQVSLHLVPSGGARGVANQIFADTVQPGESFDLPGPWFLDPNDTIRSISATAADDQVALQIQITEFNGLPDGVSPIIVDGVALTTLATTYYTCPASGVRHANVYAVIICNTHTDTVTAHVAVVPQGETIQGRRLIFGGTLEPKETVILDGPYLLEPGDFISALAPVTGAVLGFRLSPVQFATS